MPMGQFPYLLLALNTLNELAEAPVLDESLPIPASILMKVESRIPWEYAEALGVASFGFSRLSHLARTEVFLRTLSEENFTEFITGSKGVRENLIREDQSKYAREAEAILLTYFASL